MGRLNQTRRDFLRLLGAGAASVVLGGHSRLPGAEQTGSPRFAGKGRERPNILFLFTDDQAFNTVHALNNPQIRTPNMDRLVRRGTTFTHCFNQGSWSGAVCIPSRAMLNTGRYLWTCGGDNCGDWPLWGETLGRAGYDTFVTGKWHNQAPALKRSFKTIGPTGGGMYHSRDPNAEEHKRQGILKDPYNRPAPGNSWCPHDETLEGHWRDIDGEIVHTSKLWADTAIEYLNDRAAKRDNPFFMYVSFHAPHDPRQAPKEFVEMYPPEQIEIPPNYLPQHPFDQGDYKLRDEVLAPFPRTKEAVQVHISEYYAIITHMDYHIGRILDALDKSGETDNTIIVFSSDHGLAVGQHGLMGKQNQYDHSVRVPMVFCGPGIEAGRKIDAMIYIANLFATTCDMAGIATPETVQFQSLVPLLTGSQGRLYDSVYGAYRHFQRMVRTDRYKLIRYPHIDKMQLFDLQEDPWETKDLAGHPRYADTIRTLDAQLHRWMKETGDKLELERL